MASSSSWLVVVSGAVVCMAALVPASHAARAFFVFGDSLVDNGNNNFLITSARADSPPYGIDTPDHRATGRFSNGKNMPDIISEHLGAEPVLPYLSPHLDGEKMLVGANFASAGIGILNDTGVQFANIIHIEKQIRYFEQYQDRLRALVGEEEARKVVAGSLVLITLGGNDFVNNYYLIPYSPRSREFSLPDYIRYILSEYKQVLRHLHDLGARRVLVTGVGPIGCVPAELALHSADGRCDTELQRAADAYNPQLVRMLAELNAEVGGDVFVGINTKRAHDDFIEDPQAHGFATSTEACCGQGRFNGMGLCTVVSNLCADRDAYVFWDAFHPTERANRLIVQQFMDGSPDVITPMNLSTILKLDQQPLN
ncbi:GDSL esterase/lipase At5g33370-like [Oryza brachyantha]|uniref:GDSL esterase/lipase At5g33370-like n=1 Tax=Oryza brachyantha TaxID=4533 RepID=UPI001AD9EAC8|nr:GDSL esterase/lipase At5g33370-like [Oryza brachyantha]